MNFDSLVVVCMSTRVIIKAHSERTSIYGNILDVNISFVNVQVPSISNKFYVFTK